MIAQLKLVEPCNEDRQVAPGRIANADMRSREYLTPGEIEKLIKAAKQGRWGDRDAILAGATSCACSRPCARTDSGYVFTAERSTPFTQDAINRLVKIIGQRAGLALPVHFHMLRHSCGYKLANDGIDTSAIQD
jgi:site-specific recombinase XerC